MKTKQIISNEHVYFGKIPNDWEWKTVEEIKKDGKSLVSGPFGSNIGKRFFRPTGTPVIRGNNLKEGKFVDSGFVFVDDEKTDELKNCISLENDIIFTAAGTIGQVGIIPKNSKYQKYIISNKQLRLRLNTEEVNPLFAFYWFSSKKMQNYLINSNVGSALPLLTLRELRNTPIPIPSISEQDKIAKILNDFYEKIKSLQNQNKVLEQIAQTIFKSWFVDFDGVTEFEDSELGQIPKGWKVNNINEFGKIVTGRTPPTKITEYFGTKYPFITIPDMYQNIWIVESERYLSEIGKNKFSKILLPKNSVSVSCIATVGLISINQKPSFTNQQINSIICDKIPFSYVFCVMKNLKNKIIQLAAGGTATPNLNKRLFGEIQVIIPPIDIINNFHTNTEKLFCKIQQNNIHMRNLISIRDILLPKLMSGEIRV